MRGQDVVDGPGLTTVFSNEPTYLTSDPRQRQCEQRGAQIKRLCVERLLHGEVKPNDVEQQKG